jgi:uncharacterized protein YecE (DUF72 family)
MRTRLPSTGGWAYIRFHQGRRATPGYDRRKLRRWADRIAALEVSDAFVYFNNDTGGAAIRDARSLTSLLRERHVQVASVRSTDVAARTGT